MGVKNTKGVTQNFRLITYPSREAVANHKKALSKILGDYKNAPLGSVTEDCRTFIPDRHDQTRIRKFVKIKANSSIYNGDLVYFAKRLSLSNPRIKSLRNLINKQNYSCSQCGLLMLLGDVIELHNLKDEHNENTGEIRFVHRHCHDYIHSTK